MAIPYVPDEDQVSLRDSVSQWAADHAWAQNAANRSDASHWQEIVDLGWLMPGIPESEGGLGGTVFDLAIIAEELGRHLIREPFIEIGAVCGQLLLSVAPDRLPDLIGGEYRPLLAHDEAPARGRRDWIETVAETTNNGFVLSGTKTGVIGIDHADHLIVSALLDGEPVLFNVPVDLADLLPYDTLDLRRGATARLDSVEVSESALLAKGDAARAALDHAQSVAQLLEAAEALGAMRGALEETRQYVAVRKQFGTRIGDFQALRHVLADMLIEIEQSSSIILRGLDAISGPEPDTGMVSAVKARVSRAGVFVGGKGIQLHGGVGMTDEYAIGHYYKRLLVTSLRHGSADDHAMLYSATT